MRKASASRAATRAISVSSSAPPAGSAESLMPSFLSSLRTITRDRRIPFAPKSTPAQVVAAELVDAGDAHQLHVADDLGLEDREGALDTFLARRGEGVEIE